MSKQDRTYSRTAEDIERKYNLGLIAQGGFGDSSEKISQIEQELSEHKINSGTVLEGFRAEIDGVNNLANANKVTLEGNTTAIQTTQANLQEVSNKVMELEEEHDGYTEATSMDILSLFI